MPASVHNKELMFRRIALSGTRALPVRALFLVNLNSRFQLLASTEMIT